MLKLVALKLLLFCDFSAEISIEVIDKQIEDRLTKNAYSFRQQQFHDHELDTAH